MKVNYAARHGGKRWAALHAAVHPGHIETVRALIPLDADPNILCSGKPRCVRARRRASSQRLASPRNGPSVMHSAVGDASIERLRFAIPLGLDP